MIRLYSLGRLLVLIASYSVLSNGSDPCVSYNELDNPYRSTGYVAREGIDPMICDLNLKTGWYRFVNEVGGKMPEKKPHRLHCGTIVPIWMRGPHPSTAEGIVDRTACVNFKNMQNGCMPITINVKTCSSSFFVYHLVAPFGCQMAYCAGTTRPCPRGQTGLYPNCTVLLKKDFPFADVPVPKVTYLNDRDKMITLKCDFVVPTWGNVSFEIQWFVNGRGLGPVVCDDPSTSKCAQLRPTDYSLESHVSKFYVLFLLIYSVSLYV